MDRDICLKLIEELEKIRKDLDKMQAYQKTMAEALVEIATNTTPAETPVDAGGES